MAGMEPSDAINQLRTAASPADQLAALKYLKNYTIGHALRKERLVRRGLIDSLVQLLTNILGSRTEHPTSTSNGNSASVSSTSSTEVHAHALSLLSSLAQAGPAIVRPLLQTSAEEILIASIHPSTNSPKVVSAALKASLNLHSANDYCARTEGCPLLPKHDKWTHSSTAQAYTQILSQTTNSPAVRSQVSMVSQILHKSIQNSQQQDVFCATAVLDCLAAHVASHYLHNQPKSSKAFSHLTANLPAPPSSGGLADILRAIDTIVQGSKHRTASLLLSPCFEPVFPFYSSHTPIETRLTQPSTTALYDVNPLEMSVPWIHNGVQKPDSNFTKQFPALGSTPTNMKNTAFFDFPEVDRPHITNTAGLDSRFTPWLIHLMRTDKSLLRVRAARLLGSIMRTEYVPRAKSHTLALLVVPLLLDLLKSTTPKAMARKEDPLQDTHALALLEVPTALGNLLEESQNVSPIVLKAAHDAGIVRETCQYLKLTYEHVDRKPSLWAEESPSGSMSQDHTLTTTLGDPGVTGKVAYLFRCRKAGLLLVHSIAANRPGEDKYRKLLVDQGVVQCITHAMGKWDDEMLFHLRSHAGKEKLDDALGNFDEVNIAACKAATAMARSIFLLRTSLIDAGLSGPAYRLTKHPNIDVQVAALNVMCNMLVDCSPMRNAIIDDGAVKSLAAQAHSDYSRLRFAALWALKHLVSQASPTVKQECVEELGINWLLGVIEGSITPKASQAHIGVSPHLSINAASNALGERVSIFHTPDDDQEMHDESGRPSPTLHGGVEVEMSGDREKAISPFSGPKHPQHESYLAAIKEEEEAKRLRQPLQELNHIQAHALDILRNILCGPGEHAMIDYILNSIGHSRLYSILAAKLQPPVNGSIGDIPIKTLDAALKTICHIAAGPPRHRSELIGQSSIFQLLLPLFHHPESDIRSTCCWIMMNLMWVDDSSDVQGARERALMLKRMGFDQPLDALSKRLADGGQEQSHDVRERATSARDCMINATQSPHSRMSEGLGHGVGLRS